jgi:hypothetical protein
MNKLLNAQKIWQGFHWSFFINVQGLIISLNRFEKYLLLEDISKAQIELKSCTNFLLASGAAMNLAGSFSKQEYEHQILPNMTPPQVSSHNFSGLMSWDHATLIQVWKRLRPLFKSLPIELKPEYDEFIDAYMNLATAHKAVCEKFGGGETGSIRFQKNNALETLDKFRDSRLRLISDS